MTSPEFFEYVLVLTDADFDANGRVRLSDPNGLLSGLQLDRILVLAYADWCPHCVTTKPEFLKAAKQLYGSNVLPVVMPMSGDDLDPALKERLNNILPGWSGSIPYICMFDLKTGDHSQLSGSRSAEAILKFASVQ